MPKIEIFAAIIWICIQVWISYRLVNIQCIPRFDDVYEKLIKILLYLPAIAFGAIFYSAIWKSWTVIIVWAYILLIYLIFYNGSVVMKTTFMLMSSVVMSWIGLWSMMCARIFQKKSTFMLNMKTNTNADDMYIWVLCLSVILVFIWYQFMKRTIRLMQRMMQRYAWIFWLFCLLNFVLILPEMYRLALNGISVNDFILCTLSVFNVVCLMNLLMIYNAHRESEEQNKYLMTLESSGRKQAETYKQYYEELAKKNHDQRHQLRLIREYVANEQKDEALKYIEDLLDVKKRVSEKTEINSGNMVVDMLLREYMDRMSQDKIQVDVKTSVVFCKLSDADLCVLLGNLLDNAVEAAKICPVEERRIDIKISCVKKIFILTMKNSCMQPPVITKFGLKSGKIEAWKHGFGMKNVRDIIEKYDGDLQFAYKEKEFQVDVQI